LLNDSKLSNFKRQYNSCSKAPLQSLLKRDLVFELIKELDLSFRARIFTPYTTIILFLSQVFNEDGTCIFAIACFISSQITKHTKQCALNTGSFCKAKARLPIALVESLARRIGQTTEKSYGSRWMWKHGRVKVVDGTGVSMPETPANLAVFPRHSGRTAQVGFPVGRVVAVFSLSTGTLIDLAIAGWKGKGTGETSLLHKLWHCFAPGETILGDGLYASFWIVAYAQSRGNHIVAELPHRSHWRVKQRKEDQCITIRKPDKKADCLTQDEFDALPSQINVRIVKVRCAPKGFRVKTKFVLTTHLSSGGVNISDIADLYKRRWEVETNLRSLKTILGMDVLKGKSPDMVKKEIWVHMLAYNLIRAAMAEIGRSAKRLPTSLSFQLTQQLIAITYMMQLFGVTTRNAAGEILKLGSSIEVGNRPDRYEPRAVKRRKKNFTFLTEPRTNAKYRLYKKFKGKAAC